MTPTPTTMLRSVTLATLLILSACATNAEVRTWNPPTGCYQFERNAGARTLGLPWGVELLDMPFEGANIEGARTAVMMSGQGMSGEPDIMYWRVEEGTDRVLIGFAGMGPFSLSFERGRLALRGEGRSTGDAMPPGGSIDRSEHEVVAHQILCEG